MRFRFFLLACALLATAWTTTSEKTERLVVASVVTKQVAMAEPAVRIASIPLIIVGEGGTSGYLFQYAADTYAKEHGGDIVTVHDGDEFVAAMKKFTEEHGAISSFVYFGHGNEVGLYVNQAPHINGGFYANDPALNEQFRAASIYDLPSDTFASGSTALFFGCNLAREFEGLDSFAEQFANYFHVTVKASAGPTEFSFSKDEKTEKLPAKTIDRALYMIPTSSQKGFVTITPSETGIGGYNDVYASMEAAAAIAALHDRGLEIGPESLFHPFQSITVRDAVIFCHVIDPNAPCDTQNMEASELFRNTSALRLLLQAVQAPVKRSQKNFDGDIYFAGQNNLLTHDFVHKKWYTRADMAQLTWNVLQWKESVLTH